MDDEAIRAALRRGETGAAFRLVLQVHGRRLISHCSRILKGRIPAEDVVQQTIMIALQHRNELVDVQHIRGWLLQVATRRSLDILRASKREDQRHREVAEQVGSGASDHGDALEYLVLMERNRALEVCLAELEPEMRAAVQMRFQHGMSWEQIAEAVAETPNAIRMRVHRVLKRLRTCIESKEGTS